MHRSWKITFEKSTSSALVWNTNTKSASELPSLRLGSTRSYDADEGLRPFPFYVIYGEKKVTSAQRSEVSLLEVGTVLRTVLRLQT